MTLDEHKQFDRLLDRVIEAGDLSCLNAGERSYYERFCEELDREQSMHNGQNLACFL